VGPGFCDPTIECRIEEATRMQVTDLQASHDLWTELEQDLVDLATMVPLRDTIATSLVSERLENYQFHPQWGPLYEQMWLR
jgi:peptide/nickel transport system substrate-binding protein